MPFSYTWKETYTSPTSQCPVRKELVAIKTTDTHLVWDSEYKLWWCYGVEPWGGFYFYGWGESPEGADRMYRTRLAFFLHNTVKQAGESFDFDDPYHPHDGFLRPLPQDPTQRIGSAAYAQAFLKDHAGYQAFVKENARLLQ